MNRLSVLNLHHFEPYSFSNGPGLRSVIWVQGCSLKCPGCFNPLTHPQLGGLVIKVNDLVKKIISLGRKIEGITISGGEPLEQPEAVLELIKQIRDLTNLTIILFSGYSTQEIKRHFLSSDLLNNLDVLIAGRFRHDLQQDPRIFVAPNKEISIFTDRYGRSNFLPIPPAEVIISNNGDISLTGIDPIQV